MRRDGIGARRRRSPRHDRDHALTPPASRWPGPRHSGGRAELV